MVQEHDRAPGIGGDGLHATDDLGHGAAGVFFLDVEPAQRVQHHQAAALGGALEAVEPLRGHDVGQAADQRLDQQAVSHGLPFLGAEVRPKGVQAVMNGGGRVFGGQVDHRAGGQFAHLQQIRPACNLCGQLQGQHGFTGTVAKLAMRQPFVLFKGLTFQKLCLPGAFRPGDHHNKMLRPGLCVVHASPQYL